MQPWISLVKFGKKGKNLKSLTILYFSILIGFLDNNRKIIKKNSCVMENGFVYDKERLFSSCVPLAKSQQIVKYL